jgi:hypothetical protein
LFSVLDIRQLCVHLALQYLKATPRPVLLGLLRISISIEVAAYLFSSELEVDLASPDVDDCSCCVQERSSKHDGRILHISLVYD